MQATPNPNESLSTTPDPDPGDMLRLPQVLAKVGGSKTWWYGLIERGEAPAPVRYSPRHVVWPEASITAWQRQQNRIAQRKG